jgi:hypothetical protein
MPPAAKRPADQLLAIAAPSDLIEWVRRLPADTAGRTAWVDAPRADWLPYLAILRGIGHDAILRAACACAIENATRVLEPGPEQVRLLSILRAGTERGKEALTVADGELADLRSQMIDWGERSSPPPRMFWANLVLDLARAAGRGNPIAGIALTMKRLANASGRPGHTDLVARYRDKLTLAG